MNGTVTKVRPDLDRLVNEIKRVVYEQKGEISVTEAIGAIELAKLEILKEQQ
jgi:ribosomal protein S6